MSTPSDELMDFVDQFKTLRVQRQDSDKLIQNILIYCEHVESTLTAENTRLRAEIANLGLDLSDATRSRRELQHQVEQLSHIISNGTFNYSTNDEMDALQRIASPVTSYDNSIHGMSPLPPPAVKPVAVATQSPMAPSLTPPPPTTTIAPQQPPKPRGPATWATVTAKASPPPQVTIPLRTTITPAKAINGNGHKAVAIRQKQPTPSWSPGPRGFDAALDLTPAALEAIKKRKDKDKLCNNHYLRGPCSKQDTCQFEHKYKPNVAEKVAIAYLARMNPCTAGQDCEAEDCIYGHHCPSTESGKCMHPYCKFKPWEHAPDTKFKPTYIWLDDVEQ